MVSTKTGFGSDTYISFFKNRIGSDSKTPPSDLLWNPFFRLHEARLVLNNCL